MFLTEDRQTSQNLKLAHFSLHLFKAPTLSSFCCFQLESSFLKKVSSVPVEYVMYY